MLQLGEDTGLLRQPMALLLTILATPEVSMWDSAWGQLGNTPGDHSPAWCGHTGPGQGSLHLFPCVPTASIPLLHPCRASSDQMLACFFALC